MKRLVVTDAARGDLEDIARHGEQHWGIARKRRYMKAIRERFALLRHDPGLGAPRDDIRPGYRSIAAGRHVVFYRETQDRIEIVRVVHERLAGITTMDEANRFLDEVFLPAQNARFARPVEAGRDEDGVRMRGKRRKWASWGRFTPPISHGWAVERPIFVPTGQ